jgi:uncharacterized DUF497 family protein
LCRSSPGILGAPARRQGGAERCVTACCVERSTSARKHGVADEDIRHAIDHALAIEDAGEDPDRWLVIGPDHAENLLEVVVLVTIEGAQLAIHAMRMRAKFGRLIKP